VRAEAILVPWGYARVHLRRCVSPLCYWLLASVRPVVAAIASDHHAARERFPRQRAVGARFRRDDPAVVRPMTGLAGSLVASRHVLVGIDPGSADRVQPMRPARDRVGNRTVARGALGERSGMPLQRGALHVVVGDGRGEFGMRGAVAGFALQAAVALREAVE